MGTRINVTFFASRPTRGVYQVDGMGELDINLFYGAYTHIFTAKGHSVAYSQKCTHLSCAVYYSAKNDRLECPCHQGFFPIKDGLVLQGPPPRPLLQIILEREGGKLVATGVKVNGNG